MATLLLDSSHKLTYTQKTVIMQRSNLVEQMNILVPKYYDDIDVSNFECYLHYVLPTSREHKLMRLHINNENYTGTDNEFEILLSYKMPIDLAFTSQAGKLEVWLEMIDTEANVNEDGNLYADAKILKSQSCFIPIIKSSDYDNISLDVNMDTINKKIVELQLLTAKLEALAQTTYTNMPTDLEISEEESKNLHMVSLNGKVGNGVSMTDLGKDIGEEIVGTDPDGTNDGIVHLDRVVESEAGIATIANLDTLLNGGV